MTSLEKKGKRTVKREQRQIQRKGKQRGRAMEKKRRKSKGCDK